MQVNEVYSEPRQLHHPGASMDLGEDSTTLAKFKMTHKISTVSLVYDKKFLYSKKTGDSLRLSL